MTGFFDLDGDPANGCETDTLNLPGNLRLFVQSGIVRFLQDDESFFALGKSGVAAITLADPTCVPTPEATCAARLELFQLAFRQLATARGTFSDGYLRTTSPLAWNNDGRGDSLPNAVLAGGATGRLSGSLWSTCSSKIFCAPQFGRTADRCSHRRRVGLGHLRQPTDHHRLQRDSGHPSASHLPRRRRP